MVTNSMAWNRVSILLLAALAAFILAALIAGGVVSLGAALMWVAIGLACWVASQLPL